MSISNEVFNYAWNWFEYHANQRMIAFRYFLIFLGITAVALNNAIEVNNFHFVIIIGVLGSFISIAFFVLEVRNEKLVNLGRDALKEIEKESSYPNNDKLKLLSIDRERNPFLSHKLWLRLIYIFCLLGFLTISIRPSSLS